MIILVEGLDRCFKSGSVEYLRSKIKNPKILNTHCGKPPKGVNDFGWSLEYYKFWFKNLEQVHSSGGTVISDRSHLGESVYADLYRNYSGLYVYDLEKLYVTTDWYLLLLTDDVCDIIARDDGKSIENNASQMQATKEKFISSFNKSRIPNKLHIDYARDDITLETLPSVLDRFFELEERD